ncbi:HrpB1 family type III secretion system apparatus protein [Paraburkholderia bonniea]|uniref:HrpB1 family type III secretion system apparatus protein n=1 Tax=Paraburkholderia bonniea TaxID=2152891 RepID=UPI001290BB15|nr:HrpB1 family type III secretion system apparatus protein [Paraburkholderia bonniea]
MSVKHGMDCSDKLVATLLEVLMYGARCGHLEQSERLLAALRVLRPNFIELGAYDGWMLIRRSRYSDAVRVLRALEHQPLRGSFASYVHALIAVSLYGMNDPQWRVYAHEVLSRGDDPDSMELVATLLGVPVAGGVASANASAAARPGMATGSVAGTAAGRPEPLGQMLQRRHLRA